MQKKVLVIGGGAAGFFAAIRCAELYPECEVIILERGKEALGKVRISGGGRCNLTHACWTPRELIKHYPRGSRELLGPFTRFACGDTVDWFEQRGVESKIEEDGRMFPVTDDSQTIVDCLLGSARRAGVQVHYQTRVDQLIPPGADQTSWQVETSKGTYTADRIMLTTGSNPRIWDALAAMGHQIVPPVPSLFTFNIKDPRLKDLPGLSVPMAELRIPEYKLQASGPLLITHWGLSGPGVLRLSAWGARELAEANHRFELKVNWVNRSYDELREMLQGFREDLAQKSIATRSPREFDMPNRLWQRLVEAAGIGPAVRWADLSKKQVHRLSEQLTQGSYTVCGKSTFKDEFVTAGGVDLREVDFKRFESKHFPGLFMAGEVLNIDAITGGFNFQAAWTGGWIAGESMGE
ncbi:BaiN/RdsA family NAD(P)/FAD-dependent oxidoreductase [Flavilitoribacter nigricans]|uniref:Aminoacetone oxidase family FAD-binding enzyme n=1 Tax=Flavilitoribacter nigricans (strain ATCC 23147 / DSM 23189 / NBRC 102662 / NCIMB 1420 / SS-2) TaxID=1122177 RepID=A0A2D0NIL6_FLAN2|nr:NAD(P)/FAD-dependent oxidoreductase [Flavilitoribacter nigricans]PHN08344.1 aminoacetone oxidase family FAD-binding enzyme [Flavilitoribacter nigricans DSM 23189 = NBRC 102662]